MLEIRGSSGNPVIKQITSIREVSWESTTWIRQAWDKFLLSSPSCPPHAHLITLPCYVSEKGHVVLCVWKGACCVMCLKRDMLGKHIKIARCILTPPRVGEDSSSVYSAPAWSRSSLSVLSQVLLLLSTRLCPSTASPPRVLAVASAALALSSFLAFNSPTPVFTPATDQSHLCCCCCCCCCWWCCLYHMLSPIA